MYGTRVVQEIFEENSNPNLAGTMIWEPMMADDDIEAAIYKQEIFQDLRVIHYWDANKTLGKIVANSMLKNTNIAWDIYLIFQPGTPWRTEKFPRPSFWMHQLLEDESLRLNPETLLQEVIISLNNLGND